MKSKLIQIVTWILLILMILSNIITIIFLLDYKSNMPAQIKMLVDTSVKLIKVVQPKNGLDGKDGYTPILNKDYFNGLNGENGQSIKGEKGDTGVKGDAGKDAITPVKGIDYNDGQDGVDGRTPIIRCNTTKNRWEYRYSEDDNWTPLNNQIVKCLGV